MWLLENLEHEDLLISKLDPYVLGKVPFLPLIGGQAPPPGHTGSVYYVTDHGSPGVGWVLLHTIGAVRIYTQDSQAPQPSIR
jgi:hypothetical protein